MALLGFEGFDHIANDFAAFVAAKPFSNGIGQPTSTGYNWSSSNNYGPKVTGLSASGSAFLLAATVVLNLNLPAGSTLTTFIIGFRFKTPTSFASTQDILAFLDGSTIHCGFSFNTAGKIIFWRGTNATVLATGATTLALNSIYYFEAKVTIDDSAGICTVHLGGVAGEIAATGLDTRNAGNASITKIQFLASQRDWTIDDLYLLDTTGSAPTNDFLGICRVETLYPTSNNAVQWTPNSSTNVSRVQETTADGDTTYNSSSVSGDVDTFNHGSLSSTPSTIYGVAIDVQVRKDDVTAQSIKTRVISGATTQQGASNPIATSYQYARDLYTLDPNGSIAWAAAAVNATKIGYEHV